MEISTVILIAGILFGLSVGTITERNSRSKDPIYGGGAARALHYVACATITAMPLTIISYALTVENLWHVLWVALSFIVVLWSSILLFAARAFSR